MEHDEHSSISNSGNLSIQQSSPFVHGDGDDDDDDDDDVQGLNKTFSFSSASSSSFDSPLNNSFKDQTSLHHDGVDDKGLSKELSRSSSHSSSSSSDSLFEGNFGFEEELRDKDSKNLTPDGVHHQDSKKSSRSTISLRKSSRSSSTKPPSTDSPLNNSRREGNEETRNASIGNSAMQSSPGNSGSSSASPRQDPLGDKSVTSTTSLPELDHKAAVEDGKNDDPASKYPPLPVPVPETEVTNSHSESNLANMSPTDSPPTQVMDRTAKPKYRIPSHVFARNKSNNPDWSVASNDSLFSIHMGNMSFTRDSQLFPPGELSSASGQMVNQSANPWPGEPSNQHPGNKVTGGESQEPGKAQAAAETMKYATRENETDKKPIPEGQISHHPQESTASFAFPM